MPPEPSSGAPGVGIAEAKALLRAEIRRRIRIWSAEERSRRSQAVVQNITAWLAGRRPGTLLAYAALNDEVDTGTGWEAWRQAGWEIAVPVCDPARGRTLLAARITPDTAWQTSSLGTREPQPPLALAPLGELAAVLVPARAVDATGRRLGRGGGFYDTLLAALPRQVAVAAVVFDCQRVGQVPAEAHDVAVPRVIGER